MKDNNARKIGAIEIFYGVCGIILAMCTGLTLATWIVSLNDPEVQGPPGAVTFLFIAGTVVLCYLAESEQSHRRSVKWYNHGAGDPVLTR